MTNKEKHHKSGKLSPNPFIFIKDKCVAQILKESALKWTLTVLISRWNCAMTEIYKPCSQ